MQQCSTSGHNLALYSVNVKWWACLCLVQIFTNADKAHAAQVLNKMGLEDCFQGVICFETLNPPQDKPLGYVHGIDEKDQVPTQGELIDGRPADDHTHHGCNTSASRSLVLCKPSVEAIEAAIRIANADPKKTVNEEAISSGS